MIGKPIDTLLKADIDALVANEVREGRTLDYKAELSLDNPDQKQEFLKDVSAFANASGGDLIYGVRESRVDGVPTGIPEEARGFRPSVATFDAETGRIMSVIKDCLQPRLVGVQAKWVDGYPDGAVLVLRVPRSWNAPHMVTLKGNSRFAVSAAKPADSSDQNIQSCISRSRCTQSRRGGERGLDLAAAGGHATARRQLPPGPEPADPTTVIDATSRLRPPGV